MIQQQQAQNQAQNQALRQANGQPLTACPPGTYRNPVTGMCEPIIPQESIDFALAPPLPAPETMIAETCPFGTCRNESAGGNGQAPIIINNHAGAGQCSCCEHKQQPIVINNIIPVDALRAAGMVNLSPEQAQAITTNPTALQTPPPYNPTQPVQPIINVNVPPQPAPTVNLSMPDIEIPPINVHVSPSSTANSTPSGTPNGAPNGAPSSTSSSVPALPAANTGGTNTNASDNASGNPSTETAQILKAIEELKSQTMPFYDANTKSTAAPSTESARYGQTNGCCIPNLYVNVSPRFNQQLLTGSQPAQFGYAVEGKAGAEAKGTTAGQTQAETGVSRTEPSADRTSSGNQGMQRTEVCNECEDDDDVEFYINDTLGKRGLSNSVSTRFIALPPTRRVEFI